MYELREYLNAINHSKKNLMDTEDEMWEKKYPAFIVNKCLSAFPETLMLVNEMNMRGHLDKKRQFDFLINSVRPRKRFAQWLKASKVKDIEYVKEYYGYSHAKARSALEILTDSQLEYIKEKLNKGGKNGKY